MKTHFSPAVPDAITVKEALRQSHPLAQLQQRIQDSKDRLTAIAPLLSGGLSSHVKPGPVDEDGWTLLAANSAVASKLKQLKPRLEEELHRRGWAVKALRIKVQSASGARA